VSKLRSTYIYCGRVYSCNREKQFFDYICAKILGAKRASKARNLPHKSKLKMQKLIWTRRWSRARSHARPYNYAGFVCLSHSLSLNSHACEVHTRPIKHIIHTTPTSEIIFWLMWFEIMKFHFAAPRLFHIYINRRHLVFVGCYCFGILLFCGAVGARAGGRVNLLARWDDD